MEFGYTSLSFRSMFGTNNGIAGKVLVNYGTDEQKREWLERLASGDVVASFCFTEDGQARTPPTVPASLSSSSPPTLRA